MAYFWRMSDTNDIDPLRRIFFSHALEQQARVIRENRRFVHYTSAEAAVGIIQNAEVWMRKSTTMNDFSEIEHGLNCLRLTYEGDAGVRFKAVLNGIHPEATDDVERLFNSWMPHFRLDTYLACISEHEDDEDTTGRLSMWRAYGTVALVVNKDVFLSETDALKAYSSPVAYMTPSTFAVAFNETTDRISEASDYLRSLNRDTVISNVFSMFRYAVLCTKHPGFREEREWRVIYQPTFELSIRIRKSIETIRGVPQAVCKIPLIDAPEEGLTGMELPKLLNRVIIGPSQYPWAQLEAFVDLLAEKGVSDPEKKVWASDIPIRQNP